MGNSPLTSPYGWLTFLFDSPPLSEAEAARPADPASRTRTWHPASENEKEKVKTQGVLFVCCEAGQSAYALTSVMQPFADAYATGVVMWEYPGAGHRRPRTTLAQDTSTWRPVDGTPKDLKADIMPAFVSACQAAKEEGLSFSVLGTGAGCALILHVLAHGDPAVVGDVTKVCLVNPLPSLAQVAWTIRPTFLVWPFIRPSGRDTLDCLAEAAKIGHKLRAPIRLYYGKSNALVTKEQIADLEVALVTGARASPKVDVVKVKDWDELVFMRELLKTELPRWLFS
jgi:pimeloyl-ACP methyl ester carboxylesterase